MSVVHNKSLSDHRHHKRYLWKNLSCGCILDEVIFWFSLKIRKPGKTGIFTQLWFLLFKVSFFGIQWKITAVNCENFYFKILLWARYRYCTIFNKNIVYFFSYLKLFGNFRLFIYACQWINIKMYFMSVLSSDLCCTLTILVSIVMTN